MNPTRVLVYLQVVSVSPGEKPRSVFLETVPDGVSEEILVAELRGSLSALRGDPGGNKKAVFIQRVNQDVFKNYVEGAEARPSSGLYAQPVFESQTFPSALALSTHLGFRYNEVAQALNRASGASDPAERVATVRGVTVIYERDFLDTIRD